MAYIPKGPEARRVLKAIRRTMQAVDSFSRLTQARLGISGPQLLCLTVLYETGRIPINQLADEVCLSSGTLTGILDRLEIKGFVTRTRSTEDRRKIYLDITPAGRGSVDSAPHLLESKLMKALSLRSLEENLRFCEQLEWLAECLTVGAPEVEVLPLE
jgi:DNA-binding MarR family transcriptional regulator